MRRVLLRAVVTAAVVAAGVLPGSPAHADAGTITTVAGSPGSGDLGVLGLNPVAVALTPTRLWLVDDRSDLQGGLLLRTVDRASGQVSRPLLVMPHQGYSFPPYPSLSPTAEGNVLVGWSTADHYGRVTLVAPTGQQTLVAGGGRPSLARLDGVAATAEALGTVNGVAAGPNGTFFVSENQLTGGRGAATANDSRIRKVGRDGRIWTVVNASGLPGTSGDGGPGVAAQTQLPQDLQVGDDGSLYLLEDYGRRVRRLDSRGILTTVATGAFTGMAYDHQLLLAEYTNTATRIRTLGGTVVAGGQAYGASGDGGPATSAQIAPEEMGAAGGEIVFVQRPIGGGGFENSLRLVDAAGRIDRITAAERIGGGIPGPATDAQLYGYDRLAVDALGNTYTADYGRLLRIAPNGALTVLASGLGGVRGIAASATGVVYVATDFRILRVDTDGVHDTAGNGTQGSAPDGAPAASSRIGYVRSLALQGDELFFGEGCRVRKIDALGALQTVVGSPACGTLHDGDSAATARLVDVWDLDVDHLGRLLVTQGSAVYRIVLGGSVTRVAGGGTLKGDGIPASEADLGYSALTIASDATGRLLLAGYADNVVRRVEADGTLTTIAGKGTGPDGGPALTSTVTSPWDVVVTAAGDVLVACVDSRGGFEGYGGGAIRRIAA